jgi:hypothetical protein
MDRQVNGRRRNVRAGGFGLPSQVPSTPAAERRREVRRAQEEAKSRYPGLEAKLDTIANRIRAARLSGRRFAHKEPLQDLYKMAYRWNEKNKLNALIRRAAHLRAISVRANANPFSVLIKAVLDKHADRKTVSRWSVALNDALEGEVAPSEMGKHI